MLLGQAKAAAEAVAQAAAKDAATVAAKWRMKSGKARENAAIFYLVPLIML